MTIKTKVIISISVIILAFATGRFSVPTSTKETKVELLAEKVNLVKKTKKKKHTVIVETTKPNGEKEKRTEITYNSSNNVQKDSDKKSEISTTKQVTRASEVTVSVLLGGSFSNLTPVYGLSVTKPVLGPVTVGIWGLQSGILGGS